MDTKINFFKIGLFIITIVVFLLATVFWLGKYGFEKKKFDEYTIYFKESISGLNLGSSIKYKGFEVGNVNEIKINPNNSEEIQINIVINKGTPIKEDNIAVLGNLGITGLKYIELKGGSNDSKLLEANADGIKVIKSKVSDLTSLVDSTTDITNELTIVLAQTKKLFTDENINSISQILNHTQNSMANMEQFSTYLINSEKKIDALLENISSLSKTGNKSFDSISKSANTFKELSAELLGEVKKGSFDVKELSQESFDKLNTVLDGLETTLGQTQRLIDDLNQSPSDMIFKQKNIKYGPGESNEK
ncbi:lipid asymmetry ABC transporter MlaABCDEF, periplasmic component MlaD [Arcobacter venerupis]|uniref:Lipid asymmetry ABC transporter MlaABCDEF, periplasmic component MlaD n=1 Tax=Arcobacter venerupis TaxID=1054033 RepID=A0AAE7B8D1_9BACT|nr:MlaD family protein [Arcobacter venerupis]QKF65805.1 lipid asymmetry ABC transporter MlaABCDEF, periplasmic component MlaD [Arcobacter venerupis]RWS50312.1 ABC transporter substrate-binding protein [Arcobacter venerupis]